MNRIERLEEKYGTHKTFTHYADHIDGASLYMTVKFNHSVRGTYSWFEVTDSEILELKRKPRFTTKGWTLTERGENWEEEKKHGAI